MMQINSDNAGYTVGVVMVRWGRRRWTPLRSFGQNHTDALDFCLNELPNLSRRELRRMARAFDPKVIYNRYGPELPADLGLSYDVFS